MRYLSAFILFSLSAAVTAADVASTAKISLAPAYQEPFSAEALMQLLLGLVLVVLLILTVSWVLRRFSGIAPVSKNMRVLGVMPLGAREKVVLVKVGDKQILLGVAPGRVSHLQSFDEPVVDSDEPGKGFAHRLSEAMSKQKRGGNDEKTS
jgi:flagellar protein FliO/FliZ